MNTSTVYLLEQTDENPINILAQAIIDNCKTAELKDNGDEPIIGLVCAASADTHEIIVKCCKTFEYVVVPVTEKVHSMVKNQNQPLIYMQLKPMKGALIDLNALITFDRSKSFCVLDEQDLFKEIMDAVIEYISERFKL